MIVKVKPKSLEAMNIFSNVLSHNSNFIVKQTTGEELFLKSEYCNYSMWVSLRSGSCRFGDKADKHWEIIEYVA